MELTVDNVLNEANNLFGLKQTTTLEDFGYKFNVCPKTFRKFLKNNNLKDNFPDITRTLVKTIHNFDTLTTENAYWLGYIMADGCITEDRLMLECKTDDVEILEKFCDFCNIRKSRITVGHKGESRALCLARNNFSTFFDDYEIKIRKSFSENHICEKIMNNKNLFFQFLKGYFDEDGTVHTDPRSPGMSIVGDKTLLSEFKIGIEKYIPNYKSVWLNENSKKSDTHQLYTLKIGVGGMERYMSNYLFNKFYSNNKIILTRKYQKFLTII